MGTSDQGQTVPITRMMMKDIDEVSMMNDDLNPQVLCVKNVEPQSMTQNEYSISNDWKDSDS